jgi:hypothetical protein
VVSILLPLPAISEVCQGYLKLCNFGINQKFGYKDPQDRPPSSPFPEGGGGFWQWHQHCLKRPGI